MDRKLIKDIYSLSPMQEGMLYECIANKDRNSYIEQTSFHVEGNLSIEICESCFNHIIEKYEVLRTIFSYGKGNKFLEGVLKIRKEKIYYEDLTDMEFSQREQFVEEYKKKDINKNFNLKKDCLIRITIFKTNENNYKIIWTFHHIILDGWSIPIITKDFFSAYVQLIKKMPLHTTVVKQYSEYITWLKKQNIEEAKNFWSEYLQGYDETIEIPQLMNKRTDEYIQKNYEFSLSTQVLDKLTAVSKEYNITINSIFQSIWGLVLNSYNNLHNDVVFGSVVSGRNIELDKIEQMVGLFINTIPVRCQYHPEDKFCDLVEKEQQVFMKSQKYSYLPLPEIQLLSSKKNELINHIFVFENYPVNPDENTELKQLNMIVTNEQAHMSETTNYDFEIVISVRNNISIRFRYNANLFTKSIIYNLAEQFEYVLDQILQKPDIEIKDIQYITDKQKEKLLYEFNNTNYPINHTISIHHLFEKQVLINPNAIAVICGNNRLTYDELNRQSNQLARVLIRKENLDEESIIGILLERSIEMIVTIIAILKAGMAYMPIATDYPKERIEYIINDSKSKIIITQSQYIKDETAQIDYLLLDKIEYGKEKDENLASIDSNHLAYVIYTSGSTGNPKGVMIEHKALANRITWMQHNYPLSYEDAILQKTTYTFDVSVWELLWALVVGARLVFLHPTYEKYPSKILNAIYENKITTMHFVPAMFSIFLEYMICHRKEINKLSSLKYLFTSGEELKSKQIDQFFHLHTKARLINLYGPTEAAIDVTNYECNEHEKIEKVPIGQPISNIRIYILGPKFELLPPGALGEIYISGIGLARGYVNNKGLTEERFIDNVFQKGQKMYRTGDIGRWLPDGNIEFNGRIDNQVKIRGFRIEIGEIESCLLKNALIKETVVIKMSDEDNDYLCAYIVSDEHISSKDIRSELLKYLPIYMIPERMIQIDKIPLNHNGKVNRTELIKMHNTIAITNHSIVKDYTKTELNMIQIWRSLLGEEVIELNDGFFELGGHSIKAMKLSSMINKTFGVVIPIQYIYKHPVVKELVEYVDRSKSISDCIIPKVKKQDCYPLSEEQMRIFITYKMNQLSTEYNMPIFVEITGDLNLDRLEKAFSKLLHDHEVFRSVFKTIDGNPYQIIEDRVDFKLEYKDNVDIDNLYQYVYPFDLENGPIIRAWISQTLPNKYLLFIDLHHIISDARSMQLIIQYLIQQYEMITTKISNIQYKDYVVWNKKNISESVQQDNENYWYGLFKDGIAKLQLPIDHYEEIATGRIKRYKIDFNLTQEVHNACKKNNVTVFMFLVTIYNIVLFKARRQQEIVIATPVSTRDYPQVENMIGNFVNIILLKNIISGDMTFLDLLHSVKENTTLAFQHKNFPYEKIVKNFREDIGEERLPLAPAMINILEKENTILADGLSFKIKPFESKEVVDDIVLTAVDSETEIGITIQYNARLFEDKTIELLASNFIKITEQVVLKNRKLDDIQCLQMLKTNTDLEFESGDFNLGE